MTPVVVAKQRTIRSRMMDTNLAVVPAGLRRPLVVVADDNFDIRNVVKRLLENLGYGVIAVAT